MLQTSSAFPCVDLPDRNQVWEASTKSRVAVEMGADFRRHGFLFVRNHGIPRTLTDAAFTEMDNFYHLPDDVKLLYDCHEQSQYLGYRGLGREKSRTHAGAEPCEQYRIGDTDGPLPPGWSADFYHDPFRQGTILFHKVVEFADLIMASCAIDLDLGENYFAPFMNPPMHRLGLNYYRVGQAQEISNQVTYAMSPHVDSALITILTHDFPGLEVQDTEGDWHAVPVDDDSWFVFVGEYLQRWTNDVYRGTPHRVGAVTRPRMSIQYKHRPSYGTAISPLARFTSDSNPPKYELFDTGGEYLGILKRILGD